LVVVEVKEMNMIDYIIVHLDANYSEQ